MVSLCLLPEFSVPVAHHGGRVFGFGGLYVLGHSQVDELVLGLCLHHTRALLSHHLDVFGDVNITVQTYGEKGSETGLALDGDSLTKTKRNSVF